MKDTQHQNKNNTNTTTMAITITLTITRNMINSKKEKNNNYKSSNKNNVRSTITEYRMIAITGKQIITTIKIARAMMTMTTPNKQHAQHGLHQQQTNT